MGDSAPWARDPTLGLAAHPLTAPHFTAAELAAELGVDEGGLASPLLQVCVVGQALLSLLSVEVEEGGDRETADHNVWMAPDHFS